MLTYTAITKAKPADKPYKLKREQGLFLLVNPNGGKWWRFAYSFAGKEKLLSLGTFPLVALPEARQRRDEARKQVAAGVDPSEHRRSEREAKAVPTSARFRRWWRAGRPTSWQKPPKAIARTSCGYSSAMCFHTSFAFYRQNPPQAL